MKKCTRCGTYSLSEQKCPKCGGELKTPHPPKFSLNDPFLEIKLKALMQLRKSTGKRSS